MRNVTVKTLWACCAGFAAAAALVSGATVANAAPASPAAQQFHPGSKPACNPWQLERWNLNGSNDVVAVYSGKDYTYSVTFKQRGSCLGGTLTDSYPGGATGPIRGTVNGGDVTFSFNYNDSVHGTRTYKGTITSSGPTAGTVQGTWTQTGTQSAGSNATWSLTYPAALACPKAFLLFTPVCPVR